MNEEEGARPRRPPDAGPGAGAAETGPETGAAAGPASGETDRENRERLAEDLPAPVYKFLIDLSATLKKFIMYPGGHPSLDARLDSLVDRVRELLSNRSRVTVSVGRRYLMVGKARTDVSNPLLSSVAERLHGHHVLAVTFQRGVQPEELRELLSRLGRDPGDDEQEPLGLELQGRKSPWPHVHLQPLDYDPIELAAAQEGEGYQDRLLEQADLPFSTELGGGDLRSEEPREVADRLERILREGEETEHRMAAVELFRMTENLATAGGEVGDALRERMSDVVTELDRETVAQLLRIGEEGGRREEFIRTGASWMDLEAVGGLVEAAVTQEEAPYGEDFLRLVTKMGNYAPGNGEPYDDEADAAVRDLAHELVEDWDLEDPRPAEYSDVLDRVSMGKASRGHVPELNLEIEAERTLQTGVELDDPSPPVRRAVSRLLREGRASEMLDVLEEAPGENEVADHVWERLSTPESFEQLVRAEPPNFEILDRIIEELGLEVADSMLQVFVDSDERSIRRELFDRLVRLGPELAPRVAEGLEAADRWYVTRNLLSLLVELETVPDGVDLDAYLTDDERRIRTEAFKLAVRLPERRERAVCAALRDPDRRLVRLGLAAAEEHCPPAAETFVASILREEDRPEDHRAAAARALSDLASDRARKELARVCLTKRWFFFTGLADKSPVLLSALAGLARNWPDHPEVKPVLERARDADDPEIRGAAGVGDGDGDWAEESLGDLGAGASREGAA